MDTSYKINTRRIGTAHERQAERFLKGKGYRILTRNYRCRSGEIDLIAMDGNTLCFVEVKTRSNLSVGLPRDYVTAAKRERIRKTALFYLSEKNLDCPVRFDVAEVYRGADGGVARITYMKNAFEVEAN